MSGYANCDRKRFKLIKIYNFDGLIIEVRERRRENVSENRAEPEGCEVINFEETYEKNSSEMTSWESRTNSNDFVCSICLNVTDDKVILNDCQDIFCRLCIVKEIIGNENDAIFCPSTFAKCDTEITMDEIKNILGTENFDCWMISRLEAKLNLIASKYEAPIDSLYDHPIISSNRATARV